MLTTNRKLAVSLIAAAIAALGGQALAQQTPQPPAAVAPQVVRPADLLTAQERDAFRKQMEQATTAEERQKVRDAHRAMLEQRAKEKGVTLAGPGNGRGPGYGQGGPGYGPGGGRGPGAGPRGDGPMGQLFTQAERDQMRDRMHAAQTVEERQKIRDEYRTLAEARAKEKGITLPQPGHGPGAGPRAGGPGPYADLFTQAERDDFRAKMQGAQTVEERMKLRDEFRTLAEARAKEKGITLPPAGRGPGHGPGGHRGPAQSTTPPTS